MKPQATSSRFRTPRRPRRGTALYVTVLTTTLIVGLLGVTGLTLVRIERKQMSMSNGILDARSNAASALELALRVIANDSNWRTTYTNGVETTPQSLGPNGTGTVSWILEDSDSSLTDADTNLRLKGVGRVGNAVQLSSTSLTTVLSETGPVELKSGGTIGNFDYVTSAKWWAQYFKPDLPAGTTEWKVTSVEFYGGKSGSPNQTLLVKLYLPDGSNMPSTLIDSTSVPESALLAAGAWISFNFSGHSGLNPNQGLCASMECETSAAAAFFNYQSSGDTDPNSDLIQGDQASGWTTYAADKALAFKVHGTYTARTALGVVEGSWTRAAFAP